MKKLLGLFLVAIFCLYCFASCGVSYSKNEFFPQEFLNQNKLADMPIPPHLDDSIYGFNSLLGNVLYLNLTNEEYEQYVKDLLDYLRAKEDIYYLGYSVGSGLIGEMLPYDEIAPITDSYNVKDDSHHLFFSTEGGLGNQNSLYAPVEIIITREPGQLKFEKFEYNTTIAVCDGYLAAATWNQCGAEHTYDDGIEYKVPGSDKTIAKYTCVYCGSTKLSEFIGDMKYYKVTIADTDVDHNILDRPDRLISGTIVGFQTGKFIDADLRFVVNGTEIYPRDAGGGRWIYEFVMPCEDIVITTEIVWDSPAPANYFLRNQLGCEWLNEIAAEDISQIKIINQYVGVAPGNLKLVSSSTDESVIARIFEEYYWLDTALISEQSGQIAGGSAVTVKFVLTNGTEKEIYINNGNYHDPDGNSFKLLFVPVFEENDNVKKLYGFITYIGKGEVYPGDLGTIPEQQPESICTIDGIGDMEFISIDKKPDKLPEMPIYQIETEFGVLDIYGAYNFAYNGTHYLRVDGENFYDIIENARSSEIFELTL